MNQNRPKPLSEKSAAKKFMLEKDYVGARKELLKTKQLCPSLQHIDSMLIVCDILLFSSSIEFSGSEIDTSLILELITPSATNSGTELRYQNLATMLEPIRNEFPGTEMALNLVQHAISKISEREKHRKGDFKNGLSLAKCNSFSSTQSLGVLDKERALTEVEESEISEPDHLLAYHDTHEQEGVIGCQETGLGKNKIMPWSKKRDQEFYNFNNTREVKFFKAGEIWATHFRTNAHRNCRYARISDNGGCALSVTWLRPVPSSPSERKWYAAGLPVGCGAFRICPDMSNEAGTMSFSYKCASDHDLTDDQFEIYPKKGEIWAVYKNWNLEEWAYIPEKLRQCKFEVVEVISDFTRSSGADVVCLSEVDGFKSVFRRQTNGLKPVLRISPDSLYKFSHKIPGHKLIGGEIHKVANAIFELDQLALPDDLVDAALSSSFSPILESNSLLRTTWSPYDFGVGQVWAVYSVERVVPKQYVKIENVISKSKVNVTLLEHEYDRKKENLPVSCGIFQLSKTSVVLDVSRFSHSVKHQQHPTKTLYKIYPTKGEVWAMHKNWDYKWKQSDYESSLCWVVEILSEFSNENGIQICRLREVDDCLTFFKRQQFKGFDMVRTISPAEMLSFSYRIPAFRVPDIRLYGIPESLWHLEPSALPFKLRRQP